jgi:hypothetical protein
MIPEKIHEARGLGNGQHELAHIYHGRLYQSPRKVKLATELMHDALHTSTSQDKSGIYE